VKASTGLTTGLKTSSRQVRYYSSPACPVLDGFIDWLEARRLRDLHVPWPVVMESDRVETSETDGSDRPLLCITTDLL
jgi:hypothetical protein